MTILGLEIRLLPFLLLTCFAGQAIWILNLKTKKLKNLTAQSGIQGDNNQEQNTGATI
jgi:hypothetical protein